MLPTGVDILTVKKYAQEALERTIEFAGINTHAENIAGIKILIQKIIPILKNLGMETEICQERNIVAYNHGSDSPAVIMLGHMDTAFPENSDFKKVTTDGNLLKGPGVSDMKGGVALMLSFLSYLKDNDILNKRKITVLLNSDEECGSSLSEGLIREKSQNQELALIFEGGNRTEDNYYTYLNSRLGSGKAKITIKGNSAAIAQNPQDGLNAIEEMGAKINAISKLHARFSNVFFNITANIETSPPRQGKVPDFASFTTEFRYSDTTEAELFREELRNISETSFIKSQTGLSSTSDLVFKISRPPMNPSPETKLYSEIYEQSAAEMGYKLINKTRTGGSDGCFTSDCGVPTIDAIGPVGGYWHTDGEYLEIDSIAARLELLIRFWHNIS